MSSRITTDVPIISSAPPPPPPLILSPALQTVSAHESVSNYTSSGDEHIRELEKIVDNLYRWKSISKGPVLVVSRPVQHILQDGPQCGIVALSMASSVFGLSTVGVPELMRKAKELGITNNGEMFSVDFMLHLSQIALPSCKAQIISKELCDPTYVALHIAMGDVFLVPYDSDRNFSPACLQGHKAHWSLLTGVLIPEMETNNSPIVNLPPGHHASSLVQSLVNVNTKLHVLALQGKSKRLNAWLLCDLISSNKNLTEVEPVREFGDIKYIIPTGGISQGLCGRALLLQQHK